MNENLSRRRFLQGACIGVGALTLSGCDDKKPDKKASKKEAFSDKANGFPSCDILIIGSGGAGVRDAVTVWDTTISSGRLGRESHLAGSHATASS